MEKNRILIPLGGRCSFQCKYCYTTNNKILSKKQSIDQIYSKIEEILIDKNRINITVQIGYDNDPFHNQFWGVKLLSALSELRINMSFSTKAYLNLGTVSKIQLIREKLLKYNLNVTAFITLTSLESSKYLEKKAPSPYKRLSSVKLLSAAAIPTLINLRPLLPFIVRRKEYHNIIMLSKKNGALGIVIGPLWLHSDNILLKKIENYSIHSNSYEKVPWSPHNVKWHKYEDSELNNDLRTFILKNKLFFFNSTADAVEFFNNMF